MRVLVLAVSLLAACSFATVTGPRTTPGKYLECTASRTAPIADLVTGSVIVATGLGIAYYDRRIEDDGETGIKTYAITLPLIAAGVVFLVASQYGASRVTSCRAARAADRRWEE
jgi:hypothetical protein